MSVEIEAKMRLHDVAALEARLESVGGSRGPVLSEINTFFDTPRGNLKMTDQGLRVRVEQDVASGVQSVTITHKGPRAQGRIKRRSETELIVADPLGAAELLTALGYNQVLSFEKRRRRWLLDGCHVDIDSLPYLGDFVEIEGPDDETVLAVREKLQMGGAPLIRASYIAMLMAHLAEHHIEARHIPLSDETVPKN